MKAISAARTHIGRRDNNEDAYGLEPDCGLYIVADGMGGYEGGEVASALAVSSIRGFFRDHEADAAITWPFGLDRDLSLLENMVDVAVRLAHRDVLHERSGRYAEMGSTVVVMAIDPDDPAAAVIAHMGDSRIYRLRGDTLTQMTRDHSLYNQLMDAGTHDLPAPEDFPHSNIVTRALGFASGGDRPELQTVDLRPGDRWLLCSDGLCDVVDDDTLHKALASHDPEPACDLLVQEAYRRGGRDNITAMIVHIDDVEAGREARAA